jgi:hypothetical protein
MNHGKHGRTRKGVEFDSFKSADYADGRRFKPLEFDGFRERIIEYVKK